MAKQIHFPVYGNIKMERLAINLCRFRETKKHHLPTFLKYTTLLVGQTSSTGGIKGDVSSG